MDDDIEAGLNVSGEVKHTCGWSGRLVVGETVERDDGTVVAETNLTTAICPGCGQPLAESPDADPTLQDPSGQEDDDG